MLQRYPYTPHALALIGAVLIAVFFDAENLVWVLGIINVLLVGAYEYARRIGLTHTHPALPRALLTLAAWEWFAAVYGAHGLQLVSLWLAAIFIFFLVVAFSYILPRMTLIGRAVCGVLLGGWSLVLLFAPASFFALGIGAAGMYALLATIITQSEHHAPRGNTLTTIIGGCVVMVAAGLSFDWFL